MNRRLGRRTGCGECNHANRNRPNACQKSSRREAAGSEQDSLTGSVVPPRLVPPLVENGNTRSRFRIEVAQDFHAMTPRTIVPCRSSLLQVAAKARLSLRLRPPWPPALGGLRRPGPIFLPWGGNKEGPADVTDSHFPIVSDCCTVFRFPNSWRKRMSDVAEKVARLRQLRNAALLAVVIPAALLAAGCSQPAPPPPPPAAAAPPPPPPPPPPPVRG